MLGVAVKSAGFSGLLQHVISVHPVRRFKTDPAAYALGPATLGLAPREILFVSSNAWDAIAATWYGYTTLWVNRTGAPPEQLGTEPSHTGRSLRDVLTLFNPLIPFIDAPERPPCAPKSTACKSPPRWSASSKTKCCPAPASSPTAFWAGFDAIVRDLAPRNAALLAERDRLQAEIDAWHRAHPGPIADMPATAPSWPRIGYLQPQPGPGASQHGQRRRRTGHCRPARSWWCPSSMHAMR
jgi:hypothetical protein